MGDETPSVGDLERAVESAPDDHRTRALLVAALTSDGNHTGALHQLSVLTDALPHERWVLQLAAATCDAAGDRLRAAHYKKALRQLVDDAVPWDPTRHPSHAAGEVPTVPRLRLVAHDEATRGAFHVDEAPARRINDLDLAPALRAAVQHVIEDVRAPAPDRHRSGQWLGGLLLYGPPECGKAFCGEVIAGELEAPLWLLDMRHDWPEARLTEVIRLALDNAGSHPIVFYLHAIDGRGKAPSAAVHDALAAELDRAAPSRAVVLGSATYPWDASPALVSTGRLDTPVLVLPPAPDARRSFLTARVQGGRAVGDAAVEWLVAHTEGHSFDDLERVAATFNVIAEHSVFDVDDRTIARRARQAVPPSSAEWLTRAAQQALSDDRAGTYGELLAYFRHRRRD